MIRDVQKNIQRDTEHKKEERDERPKVVPPSLAPMESVAKPYEGRQYGHRVAGKKPDWTRVLKHSQIEQVPMDSLVSFLVHRGIWATGKVGHVAAVHLPF